MVNTLRMDAYRLVRSKSLWICLGVSVFFMVLAVGLLAYTTSPEFVQAMQAAGSTAHVGLTVGMSSSPQDALTADDVAEALAIISSTSQITFVGSMLVKGGALALIFIIFVSIYLAAEFESGFSKNVFASHPNRLSFLGARILEIAVLAVVFVAVTFAVSLAAVAVSGFDLEPSPVGDMLLWGALVALVLTAFAMITALTVWLTRKMAAGIVVGVILVTGLVSALIQSVTSLFPAISHLADFTLSACMTSLGVYGLDGPGSLGIAHIAGVGLVFVAVCAVLSAVALKKKDI